MIKSRHPQTESSEMNDILIAKDILGGIGIQKNRIYTGGRSKQPSASNTSGQAKKRHVEVEAVLA